MNKTSLREFEKSKVAYVPVGTLEWHGNHLPIETDLLVAKRLCDIVSEKHSGFVLPPLYLGTDKSEGDFRGMEKHLGKKLKGEIYFLRPELLLEVLRALMSNLNDFEKIFVITGHAGSKQIEVLNQIDDEFKNVIFINPYSDIKLNVNHADEYETSLLWACYPDEEVKSRKAEIKEDDDYFKWLGYDPRTKASLELGNELLETINQTIEKLVTL